MYSAERHFVTTAHTELRSLEQYEPAQHPHIEAAIGKIKQAAASVQARAVYRAALLCEDVFKRCGSATDKKFRTALARLNSLVGLYANGLFEIDKEFKSILHGGAPKPAQPDTAEIQPDQLKTANQNAAKLLQPLLHLVKDGGKAGALSFLTHYGRQPDSGAKVHASNVRFDTIMRQITNQTLREARAKAKNVSMSYAADFETIDASIAPDIQILLQTACTEIVRSGLVVSGDLVSSLTRNWQISITGETRGANLALILNWHGHKLAAYPGARQMPHSQITQNTSPNTDQSDRAKPDIQVLEFMCPLKRSENQTKQHLVQTKIAKKKAKKG